MSQENISALYEQIKNTKLNSVELISYHKSLFGKLTYNIVSNYGKHQWKITNTIANQYSQNIDNILSQKTLKRENVDFSYNEESKDIYINWKSIKQFMNWISQTNIFFDKSIWENAITDDNTIILNPKYINNHNHMYLFIVFHELWHIIQNSKPKEAEKYKTKNIKYKNIWDYIRTEQIEIENEINLHKPAKWRDSRYIDFVSSYKEWEYNEILQTSSKHEINANEIWFQLMKKFFDTEYNISISDLQNLINQWFVLRNSWLWSYFAMDPINSQKLWLFDIDKKQFDKFI